MESHPIEIPVDRPGTRVRKFGLLLLVVALDREELEVVRLDGDIDSVLVAATADDPSGLRRLIDGGV